MTIRSLAFASLSLVVACWTAPLAADESAAVAKPSPMQWELHRYAYVDFPRQLDALNSAVALAERENLFLARRVDGYQPFRSFCRYAATYTADQLAQLELIAAQEQLACLRRQKAELWRERQAIVAAILLNASSPRP